MHYGKLQFQKVAIQQFTIPKSGWSQILNYAIQVWVWVLIQR